MWIWSIINCCTVFWFHVFSKFINVPSQNGFCIFLLTCTYIITSCLFFYAALFSRVFKCYFSQYFVQKDNKVYYITHWWKCETLHLTKCYTEFGYIGYNRTHQLTSLWRMFIGSICHSLTWKDLMKVQSRVLMPSPLLSSLTNRITLNRRKKVMEMRALSSVFWRGAWGEWLDSVTSKHRWW